MGDTRQHHRRRASIALISSVLLTVSISATNIVMTAGPATADEAADSVPETPQESPAAPTPAGGGSDNVAPPAVDQPNDVPSDEPAASSDAPADETIGATAEEPTVSSDAPADETIGATADEPVASTDAPADETIGATADDSPVDALAAYVASRTRLSWNGNDYGIYAFAPTAGQPTVVEADDTAVGGVAGTQDFHAVLADVSGIGRVTYMIETAHLNPYSQDCAGFDAWIDAIPDFSATCENFKAGYFTNNGAGSNYTWAGLGDFENGPDPTVMGGDTSPATLAYDPDAEPPDDGGGDGDDGFPGSDYVASFSPFAIDGTAYDDPVPGMPASPQTFWIVSGDYGPSVVTADGDPIGGLFDDAGLPFNVFLSDMDGALTTSFLDGGVGVSDCDEFEAFFNSISGGELTPDCHAYKTSVFTPNGEEQDFTFAGFGGFSAGAGGPLGGTVAVADGYTAPPTLTYQVTPPGGGGGASPYVASYSPLSLDGVPYDDAIFGCAGVVWVVAADQDPTCVQEDDTPFAAFPGGRPISIVLFTNGSSTTTMYIDSLVFDNPNVPGGPYDPDCPGFVTLAETVWSFTPTCDAFKTSALTPNGTDEDFTWAGFDDFIGGDGSTPVTDPVAVVDGHTDPPYLHYQGGGGGGDLGDHYVASNSPLSFGGSDYDAPAFGASTPGVFYLAADDDNEPVWVDEDDTPIPAIGADGQTRDIDVALVDVGGTKITIYADSGLIAAFGGSRDCVGMGAVMDMLGASGTTCDNYKQSILTAPVGGADLGVTAGDYTFTGFDGFENGGPVTVVDGYTDPPYLNFVEEEGGDDGDDPPPEADPPPGDGDHDSDKPGSDSSSPTGGATNTIVYVPAGGSEPGTLPRTGADSLWLALAGLGLVAGGIVLTLAGRRHRQLAFVTAPATTGASVTTTATATTARHGAGPSFLVGLVLTLAVVVVAVFGTTSER